MVNKKISDLSCDKSAFNNTKVTYELALKHIGYNSETKFDRQPSTTRNRTRKNCWLYPLFRQKVKTNIGKIYFELVRKNAPKIIDLEKYSA